jgi:hypothetical protein
MYKMQTQIIQTEYGVFVPKSYNPVTEKLTSTAPSIIERALAILNSLLHSTAHRQTSGSLTQHAMTAK